MHTLFKTEKNYIDPAENAVGYDADLNQQPLVCSGLLRGFSGLWASAQDVSLWDIALAGSILVKNEGSRALIYSPTVLKSGKVIPAMAGWQFTNHKGFMDIKGTVKGFSSYLSRFTGASELVCVKWISYWWILLIRPRMFIEICCSSFSLFLPPIINHCVWLKSV